MSSAAQQKTYGVACKYDSYTHAMGSQYGKDGQFLIISIDVGIFPHQQYSFTFFMEKVCIPHYYIRPQGQNNNSYDAFTSVAQQTHDEGILLRGFPYRVAYCAICAILDITTCEKCHLHEDRDSNRRSCTIFY